jgi:ligand-binding sensor domain-containing protein/GGDEF domain-containing protein
MVRKALLLLLTIIIGFSSIAKEVKLFKSFGIDNPMSYKFVRTIAQDENGFMWFGSSEGLFRFDGHNFLSFHHDNSSPNSLSSDVVSRIIIDKKQRLWIATYGGGLNLYREGSQDFSQFSTKNKSGTLSNDTVNALFEDSEGKIWVGTENGLNVISKKNNDWSITQVKQEIGNVHSLTHNTVHSIIETQAQQIWVGTNGGGISIFDINGQFIRSLESTKSKFKSNTIQFINSLHYDPSGYIWIGTGENGLFKYDPKTNEFDHFKFDETDPNSILSNTIESIYQDNQKQIWIGTDKGLLIYDKNENNFHRHQHSPSNPYSLSSDFVITFFEDSNNIMWVGTFTGVNRWDPNMATFRQYSTQTNPELKNNNITSFAQFSKDTIYFSTYNGGIYKKSITTHEITSAPFSGYFSEFRIMTLFADESTLWIGTRASGLFAVNIKDNSIKAYRNEADNSSSLSANSVTDVIKDGDGNIWISTFHRGINKLDLRGNITRFELDENTPQNGPSSNHILQLLEDANKNIWAATYGGGLSQYNPRSNVFTHIKHDDNDPNSISSDLAWNVFEDKNKNLWVGTQASGMNILTKENIDNENYQFRQLNSRNGMKSMAVYGIVQDVSDNIWFSTSKGISRFSTISDTFKHFDLTHGLVDLEYTHGSIYVGLDNTLYFGSGKGLSSVNPDNIDVNRIALNVHLTNILNLNESIAIGTTLSELSELTLDYDDQLISFEYVGLNYSNPESTRYKYRLLGFDQAWIDAGKSQRATYTNLPAGSYQLQIKAGNSDEVWSDPGLSLDIVVKPAPWNTWWAYILYTLAVAMLLLIYSRFLNRKFVIEQQQKLYLEQQVQEKTEKFKLKNLELAQANKQLEKAAIVDKITGVKSRRYLDIYIEQTSQLMNQMHQNLLPVQRNMLPRLYILMVQVNHSSSATNSQLINLTDLLLYTRNNDDLVIRWSEDTFAIIGYEKDNNTSELASRLSSRFSGVVGSDINMNMAYAFYPFSRENPLDLSWDQISVLIEQSLSFTQQDEKLAWLGLCGPKSPSFDYLAIMKQKSFVSLKEQVNVKFGLV